MSNPESRRTLLDYLDHWAEERPDRLLYCFLDREGETRESFTYRQFQQRTREIASFLTRRRKLRRGDRALLVFPPGLELIAAFFSCLRVGVVPVIVRPPSPAEFSQGLAQLSYVAKDSGAEVALTSRSYYRAHRLLSARSWLTSIWKEGPSRVSLEWITTDEARGLIPPDYRDDPGDIAFLQYTSGSTSDPKGVVVTHQNLVANSRATVNAEELIAVSWLPQYHDMGLIGYHIFPLINGGSSYSFSPIDFLERPILWLELITRVRATWTSGPNFAYEYCLREDKIRTDKLDGIDLSSLRVMMNASEPVRAETCDRFLERFAPYGLQPSVYTAAYGLAENTLCVSARGRQVVTVNKEKLQQRVLRFERTRSRNNNQTRIVSCGVPLDGVDVRIVDAELRTLPDGRIGEIWLSGDSVCLGYWQRPELSREVFQARIDGDGDDRGYLRTGDLGFLHEGELFLCGRSKDLIIVRGVNYYPQDIEAITEATSPEIRKGCVAAFSLDSDDESLVVLAEVKKGLAPPDPGVIADAIRTRYFIEPSTIVFLPPGCLAKTSSGKIARSRCRETWLRGEWTELARHVCEEPLERQASSVRGRFEHISNLYGLSGSETCTFAEIGMDSLRMIELLSAIQGLFEEHGARSLANDFELRLLQRLPIADFYSMLDALENDAAGAIPVIERIVRAALEQTQAEDDAAMRADLAHDPVFSPSAEDALSPTGTVLLTGATGFFGPYLLASLLERTEHDLHVLVRATDAAHAMRRIVGALKRAGLASPALDQELASRVRVVCGDLSQPGLGLTDEEWSRLSTEVEAICHNGAVVNYVETYDAMRSHNVGGTRELIEFAMTGRRKFFHHISSTFIFGWSSQPQLFEDERNAGMTNLDFGYAQTKWVAEQLVYRAGERGLDYRVYRPALISAATSGRGTTDDITVRLLAFMINHGIAPITRNQVSYIPADIAADHIVSIMGQQRTEVNTFHVTAHDYYNMNDVTREMTRLYGYSFEYVEIPEFVVEMHNRCTSEDALYPLLDFFTRASDKIMAMQDKRYNSDRYRDALRRSERARHQLPLSGTVSLIAESMVRDGMIPEPTRRPEDDAASAPNLLPLIRRQRASSNAA